MKNYLKKVDKKKAGIFGLGVLFGTAGLKILSSKDAKNVYTKCTAAGLRVKDTIMKASSKIQENTEDILAEAKQINKERGVSSEVIEDASEEVNACEAPKEEVLGE